VGLGAPEVHQAYQLELRMSGIAVVLLAGLATYAAAGLVTAVAFVLFGVSRALPEPAPVTVGARILLLPGAAALWPLVLRRWLKSGRVP
jgi:hypothetical protein